VVPEARLAGMVVIERGGEGEVALTEDEALATLMSNCEDAYGFPPYPAIEGFLSSSDQRDLKPVERGIVASALHALPSTALRSETMDWWSRLPDLIGRWPVPALSNGDSPRRADTLAGGRADARSGAAIGP
jgi:hypothetical protein